MVSKNTNIRKNSKHLITPAILIRALVTREGELSSAGSPTNSGVNWEVPHS